MRTGTLYEATSEEEDTARAADENKQNEGNPLAEGSPISNNTTKYVSSKNLSRNTAVYVPLDKIETFDDFLDRRRRVGSSSGSDSEGDSAAREQTWRAFKIKRERQANTRAMQVGRAQAVSSNAGAIKVHNPAG